MEEPINADRLFGHRHSRAERIAKARFDSPRRRPARSRGRRGAQRRRRRRRPRRSACAASRPGETLVLIDGVSVGSPTDHQRRLRLRQYLAAPTSSASRFCAVRNRRSTGRTRWAASSTSSPARAPRRPQTHGDDPRRQLRHAVDAGDDVRRRRSMDLFARRQSLHSDGFPRYGYRIPYPLVIGDGVTPLPPLPADDPVNKGGATARFGYKASDSVTIDFGGSLFGNASAFRQSRRLRRQRRVQQLQLTARPGSATALFAPSSIPRAAR